MTVDGTQGFQQRGVAGELCGGSIADGVDVVVEGSASVGFAGFALGCGAEIGGFDGVFHGAMEGDFKADELAEIGGAEVDGCDGELGDGVDAGTAGDGAEVHGGAGIVGQGSVGERCQGSSEGGNGVGRSGVGEAVSSGAGDIDLKSLAAEGLGDGGFVACAVEDDVCGDAGGERGCLVEVTYTTQVAFALFADVADEDEGGWEAYGGMG